MTQFQTPCYLPWVCVKTWENPKLSESRKRFSMPCGSVCELIRKKTQPFSAHAEVSPWIHRAQLLHCLQMFSIFFCLPEFSASHHQLSNPFFGGNCFDIKLKTSPAPQWCCRRGETGGAGGISWANEARGIWHLWAGCDRAPGGAERPLSGGPEKSLVAGCCWILG